jgi:hypothetical protein
MKDLSPFHIQKMLDYNAGPVKNASRLQDGSFPVQTQLDVDSKFLKHKLLGSYPVLVRKHKTSTQPGM